MNRLFALASLLALAGPAAHAQIVTATPGVSVYRYAEPGRSTMDLQVWGDVRTPGLYQVEVGTDMLQLLSYAGGPQTGAQRGEEERVTHVQLTRFEDGRQNVVVACTMDELLADGYPPLQAGDLLTIRTEVKTGIGLRDVAVFTSSLGTLALVLLRLVGS
ncbi:MAG: SLBB domain-containing protein [Bacteroidota bacterium]